MPPAAASASAAFLADLKDNIALLYYVVTDASPLQKLLGLAVVVLVSWLLFAAQQRFAKLVTALQVLDEETRRTNPSAPPLWKGWTVDFGDTVEYFRERKAARKAELEAWILEQELMMEQQELVAAADEAWKKKQREEEEAQRIADGEGNNAAGAAPA